MIVKTKESYVLSFEFIRVSDSLLVSTGDIQRASITRIDNDEFEPSRQFMYCIDISWKSGGCTTVATFKDKDFENMGYSQALSFMDDLTSRLIEC